MAPGLRIVKRQAEEEEEEEIEVTTTATKIFGKHLHKVKVTTSTLEPDTEGRFAWPLAFSVPTDVSPKPFQSQRRQ